MRLLVRCAMLLVLWVALFAVAGYAEDFSADMVGSSPEGSFTAKLYVSGDKSRMEMPGATTINRMDKKVVWVLMPGEKMYMEQPIDPHTAASMEEEVAGEIERHVEGNETINGRNTTKYRVTFEANGKRESIFQWIDESAHIPVKTAAIDESWSSEFRNIRSGQQDQGLFEVPTGYSKMSLGIPDMGSIMGAMGKTAQEEGSGE